MPTCTRRIEFDAGHRVLGHQGKCIYPHGHRYVVELTAESDVLNDLGMVVDFGKLKQVCGGWIDEALDHGFLVYDQDHELLKALQGLSSAKVVPVPFNPTAENLAAWLLDRFNLLLSDQPLSVIQVRVWETPNCYADSKLHGERGLQERSR